MSAKGGKLPLLEWVEARMDKLLRFLADARSTPRAELNEAVELTARREQHRRSGRRM